MDKKIILEMIMNNELDNKDYFNSLSKNEQDKLLEFYCSEDVEEQELNYSRLLKTVTLTYEDIDVAWDEDRTSPSDYEQTFVEHAGTVREWNYNVDVDKDLIDEYLEDKELEVTQENIDKVDEDDLYDWLYDTFEDTAIEDCVENFTLDDLYDYSDTYDEDARFNEDINSSASIGDVSTGKVDVVSLDEKVEKHETLNPKLFGEDNKLLPEVKDKIEEIVNKYLEALKEDEIKINVEDIKLVGSNVSFNYNDASDLDVHIVADTENLECPDNLYPLLYSAYRTIFNNKYDITIRDIPVELYIETSDTEQMNDKEEVKESLDVIIPENTYGIIFNGRPRQYFCHTLYTDVEDAKKDCEKYNQELQASNGNGNYVVVSAGYYGLYKGPAPDMTLTEAREKSALKSNGVYSVVKNDWIKFPSIEEIPEVDNEKLSQELKVWEDRANELLQDNETIEEGIELGKGEYAPKTISIDSVRRHRDIFKKDALKYDYFVIDDENWYDPEGLNIKEKDDLVSKVRYAGSKEECENYLNGIKNKAHNTENREKNSYNKSLHIEHETDNSITIYYYNAISRSTYSIVKNTLKTSIEEDVTKDNELLDFDEEGNPII